MREIELTQGKVAIIDDEDFEQLNRFKWCALRHGRTWYAVRTDRSSDKQKMIRMHREILNAQPGMQIDHINGNGLDNRKENMRFCTSQENQFNQKSPRKDNKLGIKGVYWRKDANKFQTKIRVNGKAIHLGYFNVLGDADSAYRLAEEKYFGEFART